MTIRLFCATTNPGKLREFRIAASQAGPQFVIESLPGLAGLPPCEESGSSFRENAIQKALHYGKQAPGYLFVDDSGLAVEALDGAPGVYSARFAGRDATDEANNAMLLQQMQGVTDRRARFVCVVALACYGELVDTFEGIVDGELLDAPRGSGGFGYDPLFYYPAFGCTLAEVNPERKIEVSHRGNALRAMFRRLTVSGDC
jgi:XTP/dITP diphosphohydrolase